MNAKATTVYSVSYSPACKITQRAGMVGYSDPHFELKQSTRSETVYYIGLQTRYNTWRHGKGSS